MHSFGSRDGGLTKRGFLDMYRFMWQDSGRDAGVIRQDLSFFGFDQALRRDCSRSLMLVVHSSKASTSQSISLKAHPFTEAACRAALEMPVRHWGKVDQELLQGPDGSGGRVWLLESTDSVTIAVECCEQGNGTAQLRVVVDCTASVNARSNADGMVASTSLGPGGFQILHHVLANDRGLPWQCSYRAVASWEY
ncbi:unnamed protein product [Chrysoparadoxa australica]